MSLDAAARRSGRVATAAGGWAIAMLAFAACRSLEFDDGGAGGSGAASGRGGAGASSSSGELSTGQGGAETGGEAPAPPIAHSEPPPTSDLLPNYVEQCSNPEAQVVPRVAVQLRLPDARSTASATWARAMLAAKRLPDADLLRVEEFQNHFSLPPGNDAPRIWLELPPSQGGSTATPELVVRFKSSLEAREPMRLVLLVDTSASMDRARVAMRTALVAIATQLGSSSKPDELGVVRFGGEVEVIAELGPPSLEQLGELATSPFRHAGGKLLREGLTEAFALGQGGAPVHVVLLSDGGFQVDEATAKLVQDARVNGHMLSVLLLGKEMRTDAGSHNPLSFARSSAEALSSRGGGALLYAAGSEQVSELLGAGGVARRFGVGGRSRGIVVSLPAYLGVDAPTLDPAESAPAAPYAPGQTHSVRVLVEPCGPLLFSQPWFFALMSDVLPVLLDAEPGVDAVVTQSNGWSAETLLERSVVQVVRALRAPDDPSARGAADAQITDARSTAACGDASGANAAACAQLGELAALLAELAAITGG